MTERKVTDELRDVENHIRRFAAKRDRISETAARLNGECNEEQRAYIESLPEDLREKAKAIGII